MANNYESLKTDGHYTLAYRIFLKMRNWVQSKVQTDVPANAVFTDTTYTAGDNVNISQQNVISADQIDDSYDYDDYEDLPDSIKMQDKIFMVSNAPIQKFAEYDQATKTVSFKNGFASYNETTKTVRIGG